MRALEKLRELWNGMFSKPVYGSCGGGDPAVWEANARRKSSNGEKDAHASDDAPPSQPADAPRRSSA